MKGAERVHLLEAEGERPGRIVGETFRGVKHEGAILGAARDIELELDGRDRRLTGVREALDLVAEHAARVELILGVKDHHRLRVPAVADGDRHQRPAEQVAMRGPDRRSPTTGPSPRRNCRAGP